MHSMITHFCSSLWCPGVATLEEYPGRGQKEKQSKEKKEKHILSSPVAIWMQWDWCSPDCLKPNDKLEMSNTKSVTAMWEKTRVTESHSQEEWDKAGASLKHRVANNLSAESTKRNILDRYRWHWEQQNQNYSLPCFLWVTEPSGSPAGCSLQLGDTVTTPATPHSTETALLMGTVQLQENVVLKSYRKCLTAFISNSNWKPRGCGQPGTDIHSMNYIGNLTYMNGCKMQIHFSFSAVSNWYLARWCWKE